MTFKNIYELKKKYYHTLINIILFLSISLAGLIMIIYCMVYDYIPQAFLANSAIILILSNILINIYDYIITYETYDSNDKLRNELYMYNNKYKCSFSYTGAFIYIIFCIGFVVTLIKYRISFNDSINNTSYEFFLTIAICIWTLAIWHEMNKVNSKIDEYIKIIKS